MIVGLTTLEALRIHVLRDPTDDSADEKLILYGEAMSERIADYCHREFLPAPASADDEPIERSLFYDGEGLLDLSPYELRCIASMTIVGDPIGAAPRTLTASDYRLNPRGATKQGTYLSIDLARVNLSAGRFGYDWTVTISGRWGMLAVPKAIELAVLIAVEDVMKNPGSWASQQLGGYSITPDAMPDFDQNPRGGLPRAAIWACAPFARRKRTGSMSLSRGRITR